MGFIPKEKPFKYTGARTKHESLRVTILFIGYWMVALVMVYSLPMNVLDIFPTLKSFVNPMSRFFPSVADFGKYSDFPQVSQFIYSLEIISQPLLVIYLNSYMGLELNNDVVWERPFLCLIIIPIVFIFVSLSPLFYFPGDPFKRSAPHILTSFYYSKVMFSFGTTWCFLGTSILFIALLAYPKGLFKIILK
jgi:hypothetical protein